MTSLAVVGLGVMGSRIARRLVEAGYPVAVWNRSQEPVAALVEAGAKAAATPAEAAREADAVIVMISDPRALTEVTEGPDGVLAGLAGGGTLVQMSTVSPEATARLAELLPEGARLLDAPVLGSIPQVEGGSLVVLVGGPEEALEPLREPLAVLGEVLHVGGVGDGTSAKLVANGTLTTMGALLGESLALGTGLGLSQETTFEVLGQTFLSSLAAGWRPMIESGEHEPRFTLALAAKDTGLVHEAARASGGELPLLAATARWHAAAAGTELADRNMSAVASYILANRSA